MNGDRYYFLSSLPALGDLGDIPPLSPGQLMEYLAPCPSAHQLIEVLFLHDDLLCREGFGAGELTSVQPVVLTAAQIRSESPLPAYLSESPAHPLRANTTWESYFRHAAGVSQTLACRFLADWVTFEVGLRNAMTVARAGHLGLNVDDHLVAAELGEPAESFAAIVSDRVAAVTPLAELKTLIAARWAWVTEHEAWFSFRDDEFAAYALKVTLLTQYARLVNATDEGTSIDESAKVPGSLEEMVE